MAITAIVDFGMGNLFSIAHMSRHVGLDTVITNDTAVILDADAVILPGVGAFGNAMHTLDALGLVPVLQKTAAMGKPFLGICLGLQLLFTMSNEFGTHAGLDIIPGEVMKFDDSVAKVPHVGWNIIQPATGRGWDTSLLNGLAHDTFVYFVHSYYVQPYDQDVVLTLAEYADTKFCAGIQNDNVTAFQFHPERSGRDGLVIMENFKQQIG